MNQDENMKDGKYEEALERAKELHATGNALTKQQMEIVFPVLKESEDERIRKSLVEYFGKLKPQDMWNEMFSIGDVLTYLERKKEKKMPEPEYGGENKRYPTEYRLDQDTRKKLIALVEKFGQEEEKDEMLDYLEKYQPVQSATEVKEYNFQPGDPDEKAIKRLKEMIYFACDEAGDVPPDEACALDDWLDDKCKPAVLEEQKLAGVNVKALLTADRLASAEMTGRLKERSEILQNPKKYGLQKPAEWSEEDDAAHTRILGAIAKAFMGVLPTKPSEEDVHWLKTLPERFNLQPKQEWSEENLERAIKDWLYDNDCRGWDKYGNIYVSLRDLVKLVNHFAIPHHWMPSVEQMMALEHFIRSWGESGTMSPQNPTLCAANSLYADLQKLL